MCGFGNQFRENSSSTEIGEESRKYGGTVGDGRRDEQQPSRAFPQIGNGRDNQSNDNERNGKGEEIAEQPVEGDEYTCDGNGQELSQRDTCRYGDEDLPQEGNPKFFITLMLLAKIGKYSLFVKEMQRYLLQKYSILIDEKVGRNYVCADILGRSVLP